MNEHSDAQFQNVQHDINNLKLTIAESRTTNVSGDDILRREMGEMGIALRTHIHNVALHVRDNFVSKESFVNAVSRVERTVESGLAELKKTMDKAVERMERKLDK